MTRSILKGPYFNYTLKKKINNPKYQTEELKTWSRSSTILSFMIGRTIFIYNGRKHIPIYITSSLIGYKLGEFSPTRSFRAHKKTEHKTTKK